MKYVFLLIFLFLVLIGLSCYFLIVGGDKEGY